MLLFSQPLGRDFTSFEMDGGSVMYSAPARVPEYPTPPITMTTFPFHEFRTRATIA